MPLTPTPEQSEILSFARTSRENLIINALAGSAKTTTLEMLCHALDREPILSLAFNKRIADEMAKRLPGHVKPMTFNALGHRVWAQYTGRRLTVDTKKSYNILKTLVDDLGRMEKSEAYESFSEVLAAVRLAKSTGYIPAGRFQGINPLSVDDPFTDEEPSSLMLRLLDETLTRSIQASYAGSIDFDDQIYMPTLFGGTFPQFPLVMVDEAQDLSPLNHAMLKKLVNKRLIGVGDPWQSIYAFRGAVQNGMESLQKEHNMQARTLSVSFRCPETIVRRAWFRVPHMKWPDWAEEGKVENLEKWSTSSIPDGAAIICRNNAPLFSTALRLIRGGRGIKLIGSDIGPNLIRVLKKLGSSDLPQSGVLDAIDRYEAAQAAKSRSPANLADKCECLRVFAASGTSLSAAISYAEYIFSSNGPIQLLSGHKAKGLEWDIVYHLDPWRIPSKYAEGEEEREQELNIRYVIETRAKKELYLVNLEDLR
jgi:superfamily I DNA/RNA helicase